MEKMLSDLRLTNDEVNKFQKAFSNPEFCKLFAEYANEINDPVNRKRYEEEMTQMELERGVDVQFLKPTPHYVLKSRNWPSLTEASCGKSSPVPSIKEGQKVFINVCSSSLVETANTVKSTEMPAQWRLPHCISPMHETVDKSNKPSIVCDVFFHPDALSLSATSTLHRRLLDATAVETLITNHRLALGHSLEEARILLADTSGLSRREEQSRLLLTAAAAHRLKGVPYKGTPQPLVLRRQREDYERIRAKSEALEAETLRTARRSDNAKEAVAAITKLKAAELNSRIPHVGTNGIVEARTPTHKLSHSYDFDILEFCEASGSGGATGIPDRLNLRIDLPDISSAAELQLDLTSRTVHLHSDWPKAYEFTLNLPYQIDCDESTSKFDKCRHTLTVSMPVQGELDFGAKSTNGCETETTNRPPLHSVDQAEVEPHFESGDTKVDASMSEANHVSKQPSDVANMDETWPSIEITENGLPTGHYLVFSRTQIEDIAKSHEELSAPLKFRQDPGHLIVHVGVKKCLSHTLQLSHCQEAASLHLHFRCQTRGQGGTTLQWYASLHLLTPTLYLVSSDVTSENVLLRLAKPHSTWFKDLYVGDHHRPLRCPTPVCTVLGGVSPDESPSNALLVTSQDSPGVHKLAWSLGRREPVEIAESIVSDKMLSSEEIITDAGPRGILKRQSTSGPPSCSYYSVASLTDLPPVHTRRRGYSVNFSSDTQKIPFSPHESVETFHKQLKCRHKNILRYQRRRRVNSHTGVSAINGQDKSQFFSQSLVKNSKRKGLTVQQPDLEVTTLDDDTSQREIDMAEGIGQSLLHESIAMPLCGGTIYDLDED